MLPKTNTIISFTGDSTSGQRAVYEIGMTGIPIINVNNNCSTGATALLLAKDYVESGQRDCVLAVGFEKMERGSLTSKVREKVVLFTITGNLVSIAKLL